MKTNKIESKKDELSNQSHEENPKNIIYPEE